jgi:hypothetical protein
MAMFAATRRSGVKAAIARSFVDFIPRVPQFACRGLESG